MWTVGNRTRKLSFADYARNHTPAQLFFSEVIFYKDLEIIENMTEKLENLILKPKALTSIGEN